MTYHPQDLQWAARIALVARTYNDPRYAELVNCMQHTLGLSAEEVELGIVALARGTDAPT
jgi:hypothetical protein